MSPAYATPRRECFGCTCRVWPASAYLEPVLGRFHERYPDIVVDVTIDDSVTNIVEGGYDVGARLGEFLEGDMVAVKLGGEQRQLVVASPDYIARYGRPRSRRICFGHHCINWRQPCSLGLYKWEFLRTADGLQSRSTAACCLARRLCLLAAI